MSGQHISIVDRCADKVEIISSLFSQETHAGKLSKSKGFLIIYGQVQNLKKFIMQIMQISKSERKAWTKQPAETSWIHPFKIQGVERTSTDLQYSATW